MIWSFVNLPVDHICDIESMHRGAFCQFSFRWIYYYGSNKSTGKETGKTHLYAMVEFVIFCVLRGYCPYIYNLPVLKSYVAPSMGSSSINDLFFFPEQDPDVLAAVV